MLSINDIARRCNRLKTSLANIEELNIRYNVNWNDND